MKTDNQWFAAANDLFAMFREWQRQDDEYGDALSRLEAEDRNVEEEKAQAEKINSVRENQIRKRICEIPEIAALNADSKAWWESLSEF